MPRLPTLPNIRLELGSLLGHLSNTKDSSEQTRSVLYYKIPRVYTMLLLTVRTKEVIPLLSVPPLVMLLTLHSHIVRKGGNFSQER